MKINLVVLFSILVVRWKNGKECCLFLVLFNEGIKEEEFLFIFIYFYGITTL